MAIALNYIVRGFLVLIGCVWIWFGLVNSNPRFDKQFFFFIGGISILFGVYRLISFHFALQRQKREASEEEFE